MIEKLKTPENLIKIGILFGVFLFVLTISLLSPKIFSSFQIQEIVIAEETVLISGGTIIVDDNSSLSGLSLTIPENAYTSEVLVTISTEDISDVEFVEHFNPITPLITIDNLHEFSEEPMILSIPININTETDFVMAFFYNPETEELEAIPTVDFDNNQITISTSHFSSVIVSSITIEELKEIEIESEGADSGFTPGVDDWNFTNYGSSLEPGGHCAGQSVTAIYYYNKIKGELEEEPLWNRFDNNGLYDTPDFWEDDSNAYQYASVVQNNLDFTTDEFKEFIEYSNEDDINVYNAFLYAIHVTGNPQLIVIYSKDMAGDITGGHALILYKVKDGKLYVADPNFPGQTDRYINFNSFDILEDYSSGANASDIAASGATLYSDFIFIGISAFIDFNTIDTYYQKMIDGSLRLGNFQFSFYNYVSSAPSAGAEVLTSVNGLITIASNYNETVIDIYKDKLVLMGTIYAQDIYIDVYLDTTLVVSNKTPNSNNDFHYAVDLKEGKNNIGFAIYQLINGELKYVTFERIEYNYLGEVASPEEKIVGKFDFDFSDSTEPIDTESTIEIFSNGTYTAKIIALDNCTFMCFDYQETGTWALHEQIDKSYLLVLTYGEGTSTYYVSSDFNTITFNGNDGFVYKKE